MTSHFLKKTKNRPMEIRAGEMNQNMNNVEFKKRSIEKRSKK